MTESNHFTDRYVSQWSTRAKIGRLLWAVVQATVFRLSLRPMNGWRASLLRLFGAKVGCRPVIRRTAQIEVPWNLDMGDHACLGDHCIVYNLGKITIRDRAVISQYAHLCAGSHDYTNPAMPLLRDPIDIGSDAWIAADAFVGPGVTIGDRTILGARASVFKDLPPDVIAGGNPAKVIKSREPFDAKPGTPTAAS